MSNQLFVTPEVIDINLEQKQVYLEPTTTTWVKHVPSNGGINAISNINWTCPMPSAHAFMDRRVFFNAGCKISITSDQAITINKQFALRAFPLNSIMSNLQVVIDNQSYSCQSSEVIVPLQRYMKRKHIDKSTCSYPDLYQTYATIANLPIDGMASDPLGNILDTANDSNTPRGAYWTDLKRNVDTRHYDYYATIHEQLMTPPFQFDAREGELGLTGFNSMEIIAQLYSDTPYRILSSRIVDARFTSMTFAWTTVPTLDITYYQKDNWIPRPITYYTPQYLITKKTITATVEANATYPDLSSDSIQFSVIPSAIYIFVRQTDVSANVSNKACTYIPDTFWSCTNLTINFGNMTGICSSLQQFNIYRACDGINYSWEQFYGQSAGLLVADGDGSSVIGTIGSCIKLVPGKTFGMIDSFYPGQSGNFNFQISNMIVKNITGAQATSFCLYIVREVAGYSTFGDTIIRQTGIISSPDAQYSHIEDTMYGGSFRTSMQKLLPYVSKANKYLKDTKVLSKLASSIPHPVMQAVSQGLQQMGYGAEPAQIAGKAMTTEEIRRRLRRI